jgi:hypothetical protein
MDELGNSSSIPLVLAEEIHARDASLPTIAP